MIFHQTVSRTIRPSLESKLLKNFFSKLETTVISYFLNTILKTCSDLEISKLRALNTSEQLTNKQFYNEFDQINSMWLLHK